VKQIAAELRRRASTSYVKNVAKEKAVEKGQEWKERMLGSPIALGVIGGVSTAAIASLVNRFAGRNGWERNRGYMGAGHAGGHGEYTGYMRGDEGDTRTSKDLTERVADSIDDVKEGASQRIEQVKKRASERIDEAKERTSAAVERVGGATRASVERASRKVDEIREKLPSTGEMREFAERTTGEQPLVVLFGAVALGTALGLLLPMSNPERRVMEPVRRKAREELESLGEKLEAGIGEVREKLEAQMTADRGDENREAETFTPPPEPPSIH